MLQLVAVGLVVQAGIDFLRQQHKPTHPVPVRRKLLRMGKFIGVALEVVGPQVRLLRSQGQFLC